jgi:hypothetical protein
MLDGVYRRTEGVPHFQEARAPSRAELEVFLDKIIARLNQERLCNGLTRSRAARARVKRSKRVEISPPRVRCRQSKVAFKFPIRTASADGQ